MRFKTVINVLQRCHILHIEKSASFADTFAGLLLENGIRNFAHAMDCQHLEGKLLSPDVDILIIDLDDDPAGAIQFIRKVRAAKTDLDPFLPIIATQSNADLSLLAFEQRAGVDFSVLKPLCMNTILSHLDHLMRHRRRFAIHDDYIGPYRKPIRKEVRLDNHVTRLVPNRLQLRKKHQNVADQVTYWRQDWTKMIEDNRQQNNTSA